MKTYPAKSSIVKVACWNGIVMNIYLNGDAENPVVEILFAKNVFRGQQSEYHRWASLSDHTEVSTSQALVQEIDNLTTALETRISEFQGGLYLPAKGN